MFDCAVYLFGCRGGPWGYSTRQFMMLLHKPSRVPPQNLLPLTSDGVAHIVIYVCKMTFTKSGYVGCKMKRRLGRL